MLVLGVTVFLRGAGCALSREGCARGELRQNNAGGESRALSLRVQQIRNTWGTDDGDLLLKVEGKLGLWPLPTCGAEDAPVWEGLTAWVPQGGAGG